MSARRHAFFFALPRWFCVITLLWVGAVHAQDAPALRLKYDSLRSALAGSSFQRPLVIESVENDDNLRGDVYAVVDQPFGVVQSALQGADHWCDILILHLNVKDCSYSGKPPTQSLDLAVGRKFDQPLDDAYKVAFTYTTAVSNHDYLRVQMVAAVGPMSTRDYRVMLEAMQLDANRSFLHLSYSYGYGTAARFAMQAYLATIGRDKVGFSITGKESDGKPIYIGGVRAVVERNTMRYYLAIETYLNSLSVAPGERTEKRLQDWFASTDRYPEQLHEMERDEYLSMKRKEIARQQTGGK